VKGLREDLKECSTLNEMWMVLDEHYDLDKELRPIAKGITINAFVTKINVLLKATGTPKR